MNKYVRGIVLIVCSFGCLIQLYDISRRYFAFDVKTSVAISIVKSIKLPQVSRCWALKEVLNYNSIRSQKNVTFDTPEYSGGFESFFKVLDQLTVEEIFQNVPKNDEVIQGCMFRLPNLPTFSEIDPNNCNRHFHIESYLLGEKICYMVKYRDKFHHDRESNILRNSLSPNFPGLIYRLTYSNEFLKPECFAATIHSTRSSKLFDAVFSPEKYFTLWKNDSLSIDVSFFPVTTFALEPPYTTMCRKIEYNSGAEILLDRARKTMINKFGKVHTMTPVFHSDKNLSKYNILSTKFLRDRNVSNYFNNIMEPIERAFNVCYIEYHVTRTVAHSTVQPKLSVFWPQDPKIDIRNLPEFDLTDFIVYVCSSIGIWFGLSAYSIFDSMDNLMRRRDDTAHASGARSGQTCKEQMSQKRTKHEYESIRFTQRWHSVSIDRLTGDVDVIKRILMDIRHRFNAH